jgi:hypothetical protein
LFLLEIIKNIWIYKNPLYICIRNQTQKKSAEKIFSAYLVKSKMKNFNNISNSASAAMRQWCAIMPVAIVCDCIAINGGYDYIRPGTVGFVVNRNIRNMS